MKKFLPAIAAAAFLGIAGTALADEASGRIQSVDPANGMLVLEDGTAFTVSEEVAIETLQPGTEVTVSYEEMDGKKQATSVTPSE
jgi:hypothetical protein